VRARGCYDARVSWQLPSFIYFLIAGALLIFGPLRVYYFGFKHRLPPDEESPKQARQRRRHVFWGSAYVLFGLYILYLGTTLSRQTDEVILPEGVRPVRLKTVGSQGSQLVGPEAATAPEASSQGKGLDGDENGDSAEP